MAATPETNKWDTASEAVKALGVDPCLLANVIVVIACLVFLGYVLRKNNQSEEKKIEQFVGLLSTAKQEKDNGAN